MKSRLFTAIACLTILSTVSAGTPPQPVTNALANAGANRTEIEKALSLVPPAQRHGMEFLVENMPMIDLRHLKAEYLLENVALAFEALEAAPWRTQIPPEIFLNDVLPYASLNERRDAWRKKLREIALPIIKDCKTPGEAAHALNRQLFRVVNVKYSTQRKKPDQSALESMESGIATCSGLSILLVDACRAVGIPARVTGTPMWTNMRGNHTWVEVWDGDWHFTGAAEPSKEGLDHGWFKGDASKADREKPLHAIYSSSFKRTGFAFPLVWDPSIDWVPAVNVTDRYTAATVTAPQEKVRLLVRVLRDGKRVAAKVSVTDPSDPAFKIEGTSRDESADLNNILPFQLARDRAFKIHIDHGGTALDRDLRTINNKDPEQILTVEIPK